MPPRKVCCRYLRRETRWLLRFFPQHAGHRVGSCQRLHFFFLTCRNYSGIRVWDSSNALAEEYVRSCIIFPEREMQHPIFLVGEKPFNPLACKPYVSCLDFVHTGNAALFQATQILYNAVCNAKMFLNQREMPYLVSV